MLLLVLIDLFRRRRRKILKPRGAPDQVDDFSLLFPQFQVRVRGNLRVGHAVQEQPGEVVAVVDLIVATQEGLVGFAVTVIDLLAQRGRIDGSIRRPIVVHHVVPEPFACRPPVFKRWEHGFIRASEHAE